MMRPQDNDYRECLRLDGLWGVRADPDDSGEAQGFARGFTPEAHAAMPGSVNEQLAERGFRDYQGALWLQWRGRVPQRFAGRRLRLWFGSLDLKADVWVDGKHLGPHASPFLPAEWPLGLAAGAAFTLVVRLDGRLGSEHPLPGVTRADYQKEGRPREEIFPAVRFDFFPYLGLHRGAAFCAEPAGGLTRVAAKADFEPESGDGLLDLALDCEDAALHAEALIEDQSGNAVSTMSLGRSRNASTRLPQVERWSTSRPSLYMLVVRLRDRASGTVIDEHRQHIGFRRVRVTPAGLTLNGEPVQLRGFGMHEDFPVLGKAASPALRVKDFELLRWTGANSFRTSHYPYAEEVLDEADRRGVLVISEIASVNLDFRRVTDATLDLHKAEITRQIARDGGHPSVIAWSLTNEPGYLAEPEYAQRSGAYFSQLFAHARRCDASRPLTAASVGRAGRAEPMLEFCDFLSLNRYYGWYEMPGQIERAAAALSEELQALHALWKKPILMTEFGADAIPGMHATTDQLFTEEYQADFIAAYWAVIQKTPGCIGGHVWNFADFRTAQHHRRVQFNFKGVFTRQREPKLAAWRIRALWNDGQAPDKS